MKISCFAEKIQLFIVVTTALSISAWSNADDLTPQVLSLFESKCQECHHPDTNDDFPYLHEGVALKELISDEAVVIGDADASPVFERVVLDADSRKRMPKSRGAEGDDSYRAPLSADEQELIKTWIAQTTEPTVAAAKVVSPPKQKQPTFAVNKPTPTIESPVELAVSDPEPIEIKASVSDDLDRMPSGVSLTEKVHWIFEQRCSQCHTGDYEPELHGTINLAALFSEKDADGAKPLADGVVERILRKVDDSGRMPKSKGDPGDKGFRPILVEAELDAVKKWLDAGRPKNVQRELVSNDDMIASIFDDLKKTREAEQQFYRYLTLTNLFNASDEDGNALIPDMDPHRAAISKLINSLSMNARITRPVAVDEAKTVYRIDLRDYDWEHEDWARVIQHYPYGIRGFNQQKESLIERYTGSKMAYVRADWFTFAVAQPPLYDDIMDKLLGFHDEGDDDDILGKLEDALGVDRKYNLQNGLAMRAGFQFSGVSEANRLIERHDIGSYKGAYWVSYDFTPLSTKRTGQLQLAPLGPVDAELTHEEDHIFGHDGGEMVYSLPNGMQGYMLTTHQGHRLDRAPIEIVQDDNRQDNVILNGISCIACHDQGVKPPIRVADPKGRTLEGMKDEIRPLVEAAGILDFEERKLLEKLYVEPEVLQAAVKKDFDRFARADAEATGGLAGSTEPVIGLYNEFRGAVTARELASEFGMTLEDLLELLDEASDESEAMSVIASSMKRDLPVRRENLLREYIAMVYALGYELMPFIPLGYEDFGGSKYAELIASSDQYITAFGSSGYSRLETASALLSSTHSTETLAQESVLLDGGGKLKVSIQPKLKVGDRATLEIVATADTHIMVFHFSSDKHVTELFPGNSHESTHRPKNKRLQVSWETTSPGGAEHVIVYAARGELTNLAKGEVVGDFTLYNKDDVYSSRGIPKAIRVKDVKESSTIPSRIVQAKIGYFLKD